MIKVKKDYDKVPKILRSKEAEQELRKVLLKQHDYKSSRVYYQHPEVRESLKEIYRNKCAYCESVFKSDTDIVITHYRPVPKYYWLVHEWSNLLPVCRECQYEEDADFLVQGLQVIEPPKDVLDWRANSPMMLGEKAVLLNPELDEPKEHLELQTNGRIDGDTNRGGETVECYNLNRPSLLDARKKIIADAQDAINN
ncbi:MAG: hypothetical protein GY757_61845 [bacterium]|nr:hypothetical protein [bacterium]